MDWITDRLPTEADADSAGDVVIQPDHDQWGMTEWYNVPESTPWLAFKPADAVEAGQRRRIVSLSRTVYGAVHTLDAVADDGTAWWKVPGEADWTQLPALPDRE